MIKLTDEEIERAAREWASEHNYDLNIDVFVSGVKYIRDNCNTTSKKQLSCQKCNGKLEYYSHPFWGFLFGSCYKCTDCGSKWTDNLGPG